MTRPFFVFACVSVVIAVSTSGSRAQGNQAADGGLAALTAEVRQLRLAIEEGTRAQTQTQALAVYLSVQKDRIFQVASRLDGLRREIATAADISRDTARKLAEMTKAASDTSDAAEIRTYYANLAGSFRDAAARASAREQDLRSQEAQLAQNLQTEEARWSDLIGRLEQAIKR